MKNRNLYKKNYCSQCGNKYDYALGKCPQCSTKCPDSETSRSWQELTPLGTGKEIACFLTGWLGLKIIAVIVSLLVDLNASQWVMSNFSDPLQQQQALQTIRTSGQYSGIINYTCYFILFAIFLLILWKDNKRVFSTFKKGKTYIGIAIGIGMIIITVIYNVIISSIGIGSSNANQDAVNKATTFAPALAIIVFGIIGPFCEEVTYRLGLFNLTKRLNTIVAYIITPLIFGFIHFNWQAGFDFGSVQCAIEWANLPSYIIAGFILSLTYDKLGFGASYMAHFTNNFVSVVLSIIAK